MEKHSQPEQQEYVKCIVKAGNIGNYVLLKYSIITACAGIDSRSFANVPITLKRKKSQEHKNEHRLCLCMCVCVCMRARVCVIDEDITWRIKADRRL